MADDLNDTERDALISAIRRSYMEIYPTATIEAKLDVLDPGSYVAITCSPTRGVDVTLAMSERLANRGFKVIPHVAARMVRDKSHLVDIVARINGAPIESLFVPAGDAEKPAGKYTKALDLLRDLSDVDHKFRDIGVAAHPEGHPHAGDDDLIEQLLSKQEYASYFVTQMCFDAQRIDEWLHEVRDRGIQMNAWIGMPGAADRNALIKTSLRIGVGDSVRFLRRQGKKAAQLMAASEYLPDKLQFDLAPTFANADLKVAGQHVFCFNQVEKAEQWRHDFVARLEQPNL